jgi:hypothetical protein
LFAIEAILCGKVESMSHLETITLDFKVTEI